MSHRTNRRQSERIVKDLLATAKATGCQSRAFARPPAELTVEILRMLSFWAGDEDVVLIHDGAEGRLYRFPVYRGQAEWIHRDIRDEVENPPDDYAKVVVLYGSPQPGPGTGQVHFGIVAWEAQDGPEEVEVMVYRRTP